MRSKISKRILSKTPQETIDKVNEYSDGLILKNEVMKERIIEIVELGHPQSLIQRENAPITELIKTDMLIEELNEQLRLHNVSQAKRTVCPDCGDYGWIYNDDATSRKSCPCHY